MPRTRVLFFRDDDGSVPLLEWLDVIPQKAQDKCFVRLERLQELGHALRRPEADYLRDGIHELRIGLHGINYRILYFFYGKTAVVLTNGLTKNREVPPREIDVAIERQRKFDDDPQRHTYAEKLNGEKP